MAIRTTKDLVKFDGGGSAAAKKPTEPTPKPVVTAPSVQTPKVQTAQTPSVQTPAASTQAAPQPREKSPEELAAQGRYDDALKALQSAQERLGAASQPRGETAWEQAARAEYERAMELLRDMDGKAPVYGGGLDKEIGELYAKITGRGDFQYDLNEDAMWQQLKDDYTRLGKRAMQDTMGQAAALTGGYGSSYGQMAGQSAYDQYLTQLSERAPELYDRAYQRYRDEGDEMRRNLSFLMDRDATAYDRFQDEYNRYLADRSYKADRADTAYARMANERAYGDERYDTAYDRALRELGLAQDREGELYGRTVQERGYADSAQNDRRSLLMGLMELGYTPSAQEIADAGLSAAQAEALRSYYAALLQPKASGGSGGGRTSSAGGLSRGAAKDPSKSTTGGSGSSVIRQINAASSPEEAAEIFNSLSSSDLARMTAAEQEQLRRALNGAMGRTR